MPATPSIFVGRVATDSRHIRKYFNELSEDKASTKAAFSGTTWEFSRYSLDEKHVGTLFNIRWMLSHHPELCRIMGVHKDLGDDELMEIHDYFSISSAGAGLRNEYTFEDRPSPVLTMDFDGLPAPFDVVKDEHLIQNHIATVLANIGAGYLMRSCVIQLTSRHGIKSRNEIRAHVDWMLERPLELAQQKNIATHINVKLEEAGYPPCVDVGIYKQGHLLVTAPPHITGETEEAQQLRKLVRVRQIRFNAEPYVTPPVEHISEPANYTRQHRNGAGGGRKFEGERFVDWRPEKTDDSITGVQWKHIQRALDKILAKLSNVRAFNQAYQTGYEECELEIRNEDATPEKTAERLDDLRNKYPNLWTRSIAKALKTINIPNPPKYVAPPAPYIARTTLRQTLKEAIEDARDWVPSGFLKKAPLYAIHASAGMGKSTETIKAIEASGAAREGRVLWVSPTDKLSTQSYELAIADIYAPSAQLRGRRQHCFGDAKERADLVDSLRLNVKKSVCPTCPNNIENGGSCGWPVQKIPEGNGITFATHAHLATQLANIEYGDDKAFDMIVIDESCVDTLGTEIDVRTIETLRECTKGLEISRHDGNGTDWGRTNDAIIARTALLDAIDVSAGGHLPMYRIEAVSDSLEAFIEEMMRTERETIEFQYMIRLQDLAKQEDFNPRAKAVERLIAIKHSARMFYQLCRAIKASLDHQLPNVIGCRTTEKNELRIELNREKPKVLNKTPLIYLDATASDDGELERAMFEDTHDVYLKKIAAMTENVHLTQYVDFSYSKTWLENLETDTKRLSRLRHIAHCVLLKCLKYKDVLLICPLGIEQKIRASYNLPYAEDKDGNKIEGSGNLYIEHYKNLKGKDRYKNVRAIVQVGYHMPPTHVLEDRAEGMLMDSGRTVQRRPESHGFCPTVKDWRMVRAADGSIEYIVVNHPQHPDPFVEYLRYQEHDGECIQGLNRGRLFRDENNPLDITVFGTFNTGIPIDDVRSWDSEFDNVIFFKNMWEEAGVLFREGSGLNDEMFMGAIKWVGRDRRIAVLNWQSRLEREWPIWRFSYSGIEKGFRGRGYELCKIHIKHAQNEDNIRKLIKMHTGKDAHYVHKGDSKQARLPQKGRKKTLNSPKKAIGRAT